MSRPCNCGRNHETRVVITEDELIQLRADSFVLQAAIAGGFLDDETCAQLQLTMPAGEAEPRRFLQPDRHER